MGLLGILRPFRKKQKPVTNQDMLNSMAGYPTHDSIAMVIRTIEANKERKQLWDSLSTRQQGRVLTHIVQTKLNHPSKKHGLFHR